MDFGELSSFMYLVADSSSGISTTASILFQAAFVFDRRRTNMHETHLPFLEEDETRSMQAADASDIR